MAERFRNGEGEGARDASWMRMALQLAEASTGLAAPNPRVGCVVVKGGEVLGRGAHYYDRKDHAEVVALREAGAAARGATAYVTLEPCAHTGRTAPCAAALLAAGVARVVVATGDPNPLVNGRGTAMLREQGVAVTMGVMAEEARTLNDGFARWIRTGLPFVLLKAAVSLDGRVAPPQAIKPQGSVAYLTGARSLLAVQKLRHAMDAVLTGIGTVLEDNPLITDRSGGARRRNLLRVVLDSRLRLPLESRLVHSARGDVLVLTGEKPGDEEHRRRRAALEQAGIAVCTVSADAEGRLDVRAGLRLLGQQYGVLNVMAEGGPRLNRTLLERETAPAIADKLCLFFAPMFLGDEGVPLLAGGLPLQLEYRRFSLAEVGSDFRVDAYLRDPWREIENASGTPASTSLS